jgi:hypothetical protein
MRAGGGEVRWWWGRSPPGLLSFTLAASPTPAGGGGCSEPGRCQGAPPRYERGGLHTMVVSSELTQG